ncbi:hypothetical protein RUM44_003272 [Polyplax serrata]|uniref:C-type lectin domain-containing protein n=1 Tax=Polyplax serrata TaxID=468196 RepID=A0ABR1AFZ4_POLSC
MMKESRPEFHLVAPCSISGMTILASTNTSSVRRCSQFANLKQGLAFNYKAPGRKRTTPENCLIYDCPESEVLQSIQREKGFNYYSLFADPLPSEDMVCVVGVGIFRLHENKANYTEAMKVCRDEGGELASVLSSKRTIGLSNMISNLKHDRLAYVGLDDIEHEGKFMTASGKLANCFEYRAWGLGEPKGRRQEEDCVVIDAGRNWKVVDCSKRLPFICELLPKGPFPIRDERVEDVCQLDLSNRKLLRRVSKTKNFYKNSIAFHWISNFFKL